MNPTLGCSIEISRDIYMSVYTSVCLQKISMPKCVEGLRGLNTRMLNVSFGQLKRTCDTRIIHFYYTLEQL